ncbi:sensor histidine kinase [Paenibacillus sp. TRM 82003]|nr:sensor histidine kinase [Paenibacillus sp. TRM 82003]
MRGWIWWFRNVSVTWKFVFAYSAILAVSLAASGIYLYSRLVDTAVEQAQQVMEYNLIQTRDSIVEKTALVENIASLVTSDIKLQSFLGTTFTNDPLEYEDYRSNVTPFVDNVLRQNPYIHSLRIFMYNETIPEVYDSFYRVERLGTPNPYATWVESVGRLSGWRGVHPAIVIVRSPSAPEAGGVFSYYAPIQSFRYSDQVGFLEIEMKQDVMFEVLSALPTSGVGDVFVVDAEGAVVSGLPGARGEAGSLEAIGIGDLPLHAGSNRVLELAGKPSIVISAPTTESLGLRVVGVFPVEAFTATVRQSARQIAVVLFAALLVLGTIVYVITAALLKRLKLLLRAMKKVKDGALTTSVPVRGNDEFSQIASSFNLMTGRIHELVETVYKIQLMEREAELRALESQVNPHFLYNTLATISWVARKGMTKDIVEISNALAKYYRLMLNKGKREILIKDEIAMVKAYLDIQKFRYEEMFDVVYDIDERVYAFTAAKNLLQPIVENALVHGIEPKRDHGTLIIQAGFVGDMLFYKVIDDGVGMRSDRLRDILEGRDVRSSGSGYAMKNIRDRLQGYYGGRHSFEMHSGPGIGTAVAIKFGKEKR